ncbi:Pleiotropic drug resistance protein 4 [Gossypium australe]|uniref:Pleiotropic drug resistance protein 4 n=1 Tax=Gossypium australe TaxID=47621 RepID=A0A5B6WU33_9ROSI|nr:Pleiotropic drug resistance protein 4 [Gossypium australe]
MERVQRSCGFFNGIDVDPEGSKGGLCLAWKGDVSISLQSFSKRHIDVLINDSSNENGQHWRFTGFYDSPYTHEKDESWIAKGGEKNGSFSKCSRRLPIYGCGVFWELELFEAKERGNCENILTDIEQCITDEDNHRLTAQYTQVEIWEALQSMSATKAPGEDGFPTIFFQKFWHIIGVEVSNFCLQHLNGGMEVLDKCIDKAHSAFVLGRLISDNVLLAYEILHTLNRKKLGKKGWMAVKLDMSKAYDRVEWSFVQDIMRKMGFDPNWISANTREEEKCLVTRILGVQSSNNPERYLGLPNMVGRRKKEAFQNLKDWFKQRIDNWSVRHLSQGGKEVFIKAVLQAISTYTMACFLLPKTLCAELDSLIAKFWWQKSHGKQGIHWCAWKELCTVKEQRGFGFRRNLPSLTWHTVWAARGLLQSGLGWRIGKGKWSLIVPVLSVVVRKRTAFTSSDNALQQFKHGKTLISYGSQVTVNGQLGQISRQTEATIFFDAAFDNRTSRLALGLVVRGEMGELLASKAVLHSDVSSPFMAEAYASLKAVEISLGFQSIRNRPFIAFELEEGRGGFRVEGGKRVEEPGLKRWGNKRREGSRKDGCSDLLSGGNDLSLPLNRKKEKEVSEQKWGYNRKEGSRNDGCWELLKLLNFERLAHVLELEASESSGCQVSEADWS